MEVSAIEGLLESFAIAALGLELKGPIRNLGSLQQSADCPDVLERGHIAWAAWHTDRGVVTLRAAYDEAQSLRVKAQVVKISWWIRDDHYVGWWHCYPKFPRDWIKGVGRL